MKPKTKSKDYRINQNPIVFNLMRDSDESESDIISNISQNWKEVEFDFSIEINSKNDVFQLQDELNALLKCLVQDPFYYNNRVVLTGLMDTPSKEIDEVLSKIRGFCQKHSCALLGWAAFPLS